MILPKTKGWFDPTDRPLFNPADPNAFTSYPAPGVRIADASPMFCERRSGGNVKMSGAAVMNFLHAAPRGERYVEWTPRIRYQSSKLTLQRLQPIPGGFVYHGEYTEFFEEIGCEEVGHNLRQITDAQLVHLVLSYRNLTRENT